MNILADQIPKFYGWIFICVGVAGLFISGCIWLFQYLKSKGLLEKLVFLGCKYSPEKSICVKRTWINYNRLEKDHVIDFTFDIFNGSYSPINIANPSGNSILKIDKVNETLTPIQKLPLEIPPYSEDRIFVEQVLSAEVKQRFLEAIEQKKSITFDLSDLNINVRINNKSKTEFSLPKWDMFGSYHPSDVTKFDIIISMSLKQID